MPVARKRLKLQTSNFLYSIFDVTCGMLLRYRVNVNATDYSLRLSN